MTDFVSTMNVKSMYDFLYGVISRENWAIYLHDKRGVVGGTLYGYRWTNDTWVNWYNFNEDGLSSADFWKMCEDYTVNGIECEVRRDGEYVNIIHAYKGVEG